MKTKLLALSLLLSVTVCTADDAPPKSAFTREQMEKAGARPDDVQRLASMMSRVEAEAKVLKVYSAEAGDAVHRTYLADWKGREIVVNDQFADAIYKEGDTISILVMKMPVGLGDQMRQRLTFQVKGHSRASIPRNLVVPPYTQAEAKVLKVFSVKDGEAVSKSYLADWKGQEVVVSDVFADSNYKEGETISVIAMKTPPGFGGGEQRERLLFQVVGKPRVPAVARTPGAAAQQSGLLVNPKPVTRVITNTSVYFECRGNEVFFVDADGLKAKAKQHESGNDIYRFEPGLLALGVVGLIPKPGVHGESLAELDATDSKFKSALGMLNPSNDQIFFFVRPDSAEASQKARGIAEASKFRTGTVPLENDVPMTFDSLGDNMPTIAVLGTFDTKGEEHRYVEELIRGRGKPAVEYRCSWS